MPEHQQPRKLSQARWAVWLTEDHALSPQGCPCFRSIRSTEAQPSGTEEQDKSKQPGSPVNSTLAAEDMKIHNDALNLTAIPLALHCGRLALSLDDRKRNRRNT